VDKVQVAAFEGAAISGGELQDAVDDVLAEIIEDPASRGELAVYGLDENELRAVKLSVEQEPGIDPASVVTLIFIASAGQLSAEGIKALWEKVAQRVRKRKGADALGEKR
jgi:hypothetical protein